MTKLELLIDHIQDIKKLVDVIKKNDDYLQELRQEDYTLIDISKKIIIQEQTMLKMKFRVDLFEKLDVLFKLL